MAVYLHAFTNGDCRKVAGWAPQKFLPLTMSDFLYSYPLTQSDNGPQLLQYDVLEF